MLTKLSRETLAEQAARNLIAFIEDQGLKPGKLLPPETKLAADLGVSRPIIREALKSLEGKGIIEVVSGKGAMVKPLDSQPLQLFFERAVRIESEAIIDLIELRRGIEVQSAILAAQRRTPEEVAELAEIIAGMRRSLRDPDAYVELDVAFHRLIAAMTRNAMIYYMVTAVRESINDTVHESMLRPRTDEQLERVQAGHEAILASLEQGDAEAAGQAMTAHFAEAVMSLVYSTSGGAPVPEMQAADLAPAASK
jgi:GntR family transcriptional regulator, transcriptional repressor for pyruvate dehydrogenase complex